MTSTSNPCTVGDIAVGPGLPLVVIAGPCVLESLELGLFIGTQLKQTCQSLGLPYIFKASFDKANRTSIDSPRGPGIAQGLEWIAHIGETLGVPTTTDVHEPSQCLDVARSVDLLQIPAFLSRQTDLLAAAGRAAADRNRAVNIKKGQFLSPTEMAGPIRKVRSAGCRNIMLTERGTFFGYGRLVNDFLGVAEMIDLPDPDNQDPGNPNQPWAGPVCFDVTHSTQRPGQGGSAGEVTGGSTRHTPALARAAVALGVHALFLECHPNPKTALSDAATMLPLEAVAPMLRDVAAIRNALLPQQQH